MNTIRFSHRYAKMPPGSLEGTRVLEVFSTTKKDLSPGFIAFDTTILGTNEQYPLPEGRLLVILLLTRNHLWQTIRRATYEKEVYYAAMRGQEVEIMIEEKE